MGQLLLTVPATAIVIALALSLLSKVRNFAKGEIRLTTLDYGNDND